LEISVEENKMTGHFSKTASKLSDFHLPGLQDKKVAITAGASGIGFSIARLLHTQGVKIAICDVDATALRRASVAMEGSITVEADVSDEKAVETFFDAVQEALGGALVNMASAAAKHGYAYRTPYSAAKFGVIGLTQSLAKELGPENIRVNAVLPGIVEGPRMEGVIRNRAAATGVSSEEMRAEYIKNISLRRMVSPEDVASTVAYLISDLGRNVSGQSISVDGNVETL
jgi:NAD(P)-dependent dehydrogenase (short-subunit alcohol dehydrogenase family)